VNAKSSQEFSLNKEIARGVNGTRWQVAKPEMGIVKESEIIKVA